VVLVSPDADEEVEDLPVFERLARAGQTPRGGLYVIDLGSGAVREALHFGALDHDAGEIAAIRGCARPAAIGFQTDEISRILYVGGERPLGG
jgi:hypothetical protein